MRFDAIGLIEAVLLCCILVVAAVVIGTLLAVTWTFSLFVPAGAAPPGPYRQVR